MAFSNLSQTMQDLLMVNFEFFGKLFLFVFLLSVCLWFINKQDDYSPYILVAAIRAITRVLAWAIVFISPMFIMFLYPQVELSLILQYLFLFYTVGFVVLSILVTLNIFYLAPLMILRFGGYDPDKKRTNEVLNRMSGFVEGLPFSGMVDMKKINVKEWVKNERR